MTVSEWLRMATVQLTAADIGTARLDALVLLEDTLHINRARLLAEPDRLVAEAQSHELEKLLTRRMTHEPLAYVRGKTEFYGRTFVINNSVLEPRPESETMIDLLKNIFVFSQAPSLPPLFDTGSRAYQKINVSAVDLDRNQSDILHKNTRMVRIADVGTGSGALGITAHLELKNTSVDLLDISDEAIGVAKSNVDLFTLNISVIKSNLLADTPQDYDILLCNLPYVPDEHMINRAASYEPKVAIFGGPDGLDLYRKLFKQISHANNQPLYILTEALPPQHAMLADIAVQHDYQLIKTDDFIQVFTPAQV
jgi:release factor glutamine methyltransferase